MDRLIATVEALRVAKENAALASQRAAETKAAVQAAERDVADAAEAFVANGNTAGREEHHGQHVPVPEATAPINDGNEADAAAPTHNGNEADAAAPDAEPHNEADAAAPDAEPHNRADAAAPDAEPHNRADAAAPNAEQRIADHEGTTPLLQDVRAFLRDGHWFIHLGSNRGLPERDEPVHHGERGGWYYYTPGGSKEYIH